MVKSLTAFGSSLAVALDDRTSKLKLATLIAEATDAGYSLQEIADSVGDPAARRAHPAASDDVIATLATTPRAKGGYALSKPSVAVYLTAWNTLMRAGVEPSVGTYGSVFRLVSRPGSSEQRELIVAAVAAVEAEHEKAALITTLVTDALAGINLKRSEVTVTVAPEVEVTDDVVTPNGSTVKGKGPKPAPAEQAPVGSMQPGTVAGRLPAGTAAVVPVSAEVALETIARIAVQEWSPADALRIREAFAAAAELIGVTV